MKFFKKTISVIMLVVLVMTAAPLSGIAEIDFAGLFEKAFAEDVNSDEYKVIINWSASPRDLDSHLEGYDSYGSSFHVYYSNRYAYDSDGSTISWLDQDITTGYGPETLRFTPVDSSKKYTYYIYNYGGDGRISNSQAHISLYKGETLIGEYIPPSSEGRYWTLFYVQYGNVYLVNKIGDEVIHAEGSIQDYKLDANRNDIVLSTYGRQIAEQDGLFVPADKKKVYEKLSGVNFSFSGGASESADDFQYTIASDNPCGSTLTLSHSGFRDYIIPSVVLQSWKAAENVPVTKTNPAYNHNAYMVSCANNSKPYISTVFGRNKGSDPFVELTTSDISLIYNSDSYVYISAGNLGGEGCKYYILQDASHKVESTNGVFSVSELYANLQSGKSTYAFVVTDSGKQSSLEAINVKKESTGVVSQVYDEYISKTTLNILGDDFAKITISDSVPLIGGAEISFNAFKLPAGFELEGNTIKVSVGANIFNAEKANGDTEYTKEMFKDWKDLVNNLTTREATDKTIQKQKKAADKYKTNKDVFCSKWGGTIPASKSKNWNLNALGYMELFITDTGVTVKEASISVAGEFTFKYNVQGSIGPVPVYCYVEAGASVGATATGVREVADSLTDLNFDITFSLSPELTVGGGIGIEDAISAGAYGSAEMPMTLSAKDFHFTLGINGSLGVEAQFLMWSGQLELWSGSRTLVDTYFGSSSPRRIVRSRAAAQTSEDINQSVSYSLADRSYLNLTSEWLGAKFSTRRKIAKLSRDGLSLQVLQSYVFPEAYTQVVTFGDKMLMAWIEDDGARDEYNRMRLVYSIFENGAWSMPKAVFDDGHNDNLPMIVSDGKDVFFAWQKTNKILTAENTLEDMVNSTEIWCAKYDSDTDSIQDTVRVTDNDNYDYAQSVSYENGDPVVYWVTNNNGDLLSGNDNTLNRYVSGGDPEIIKEDLGYVIETAVDFVDGKEQIALVVDTRSDDEDVDGISVFTITDSEMTAFADDNAVYSDVFYGTLDSETTLFVSDYNNIYYKDEAGETISVFDSDRLISGNIQLVSDDESSVLLWTEAESDSKTNAVYSSFYENGGWTEPVRVSNTSTELGSVDAVIYDGIIRGVCTSTIYTESVNTDGEDVSSPYSEPSSESDSSVYEESSSEAVSGDDSPVYVRERTDLCAFSISEMDDISVDGIYIDERDIKIGEPAEFTVLVSNNGTNTVEKIKFEISDGLGYSEDVELDVNLASGEHRYVTLTYTAPEDYSRTDLTVSASSGDVRESDLENNTASVEIGVAKIVINESEVSKIGDSFIIDTMVTNESDVYTDLYTVSVYSDPAYTTRLSTVNINGSQARSTSSVKFEIPTNYISFDENDRAVVYVRAEGDNITEAFGSFIINNIDYECMHPVTDTETVAPTCTEDGYERLICTGCGEIIEETSIPALGHNFVSGKCGNCGIKITDISVNSSVRLNHNGHEKNWLRFVPATNGTYYFYSDCSCDTYGQIFDENFNSIYTNDDGGYNGNFLISFYANAGKVYYLTSRLYDSGSYASNVRLVLADNADNHSYRETDRTNATCTSNGEIEYKCSDCGKEKTETINKTGHTSVKVKGKAATCTEKGLTDGVKCSVCGTVITAQRTINALGHKEVKVAGKAATCTKKGLTDGVGCSVCGMILTGLEEIKALGHKYADGKCTVCSASDPNYKPAETTTAKPAETTTAKQAEKTTAKPAETTTAKPAETTTAKQAETTTAKQAETTTVKPAETTTAKPAETTTAKPAETTTAKKPETTTAKKAETTTKKSDDKKELSLVEGCKQVLDNAKKTVSVVLEKASGMTIDDFIKMFTDTIKVESDKNGLAYNGMKFKHGENEYTVIIKGDTEADGKITAKDARKILRISARLESPDEVTRSAADIDSNSKVTAAEARAVLRYAAKLSKSIESELPK